MPQPRKVEIQKQSRLFDDFFKIDEVMVVHERRDGTMSPPERRLVFERGDSVAILLYNADTNAVVAVTQFKVPTLLARRRDDAGSSNGWITEATAGMIDPHETAEQAVIRETAEETGYRIANPKLISTFFSSPGGTSERIFLYFAKVREGDRIGAGGGLPGEDITVLQIPLTDLMKSLAEGSIEDPKLAIGAAWLKDHLQSGADDRRLVESMRMTLDDLFQRLGKGSIDDPKLAVAAAWLRDHLAERDGAAAILSPIAPERRPSTPTRPRALAFSTVRHRFRARPQLAVGYKTGPIDDIRGVDVWVNSENTDMLMDRIIGRSISARIRYLGANKDADGNVIEDTIAEALRNAVGPRGHVKLGTVLATESGLLGASPHHVRRLLHVASVESAPGAAIKGARDKLTLCIRELFKRADAENKSLRNIAANFARSLVGFKPQNFESILIPMMGAGEGGLPVEEVAQIVVPEAIEQLRNADLPTLKQVYFLAYTSRDKDACDAALAQFCTDGTLLAADDGR